MATYDPDGSIEGNVDAYTEMLKGKLIERFEYLDGKSMGDVLRIVFADGARMDIQYDYIYGVTVELAQALRED